MNRSLQNRSVVLIGMPCVGKSTVGVLLAKAMSREFIDTDLLIQARQGRRLQDIIDADGLDVFGRIEQEQVLALDASRGVIATGGSVVYSDAAMEHLKRNGVIVHLELDLPTLAGRAGALATRGVVMAPGQSLQDLYLRRLPLYRRWADVTVDCHGLSHEAMVEAVLARL